MGEPINNWPTRCGAETLHRAEQWTSWQSDPAAIARIEMDEAKREDRERADRIKKYGRDYVEFCEGEAR